MAKCICPKCKSENIVPIMYGYPSHEAFEEAEKGNLKLGGCEFLIDGFAMPDRFCKDCETKWCVERLEADAIKKVRFKYWSNWGFYDPDSIVEDQWAFEIFKDGTIKYFAYPRKSRMVLDKDKALINTERVQKFYEKLLDALKPWNAAYKCRVCDGCSYRLDITYCDGRKRSHIGDIGGGTIDKLVMDFLESISEMKEKLLQVLRGGVHTFPYRNANFRVLWINLKRYRPCEQNSEYRPSAATNSRYEVHRCRNKDGCRKT